ncbi:MAG: M23 family peptidase [Alphaproteobacteria bacterium HGW-Alphaproteobacteria-11]|nr:MAG: M23 family peptidase [Alphaproteobacteria bacterium HGW-Alphaproteobacteria-11]
MRRGHGMRVAKFAGALASMLLVAACGGSERPWWDGGPSASGSPRAPLARPASLVAPGGTYIVRRGDTVHSIARAHDVPLRSIIDANRLNAPYTIEVGQRLTIPAGRFHIVQSGDTVYSISRQHNVDMASLTSLNRIQAPYTIKVGERLQLPGRGAAPQPAAVTRDVAGGPVPVARPVAGVATAATQPASATPSVPKTPLPATPPATGGFVWPVEGKILSSYGPKANGLHNDGINIAAEMGAPVKAAQNGVVAYAGNELKGYGNLLLIRHEGDLITAYAHNSKLLVQRGDTILRGQTIAQAGNSGSVVTPQVHFEVRRGAKALDPMSVIGR